MLPVLDPPMDFQLQSGDYKIGQKYRNMSEPAYILVVEDNEEIRIFLKIALENQGFQVHMAEDAGQAIEALRHHRFNVAIIDRGLPDMTGIELGQIIRQQPHSQTLPLVLFSGSFTKALEKEAFDAGFSRYLVKPVPVLTLYQVINELVQ